VYSFQFQHFDLRRPAQSNIGSTYRNFFSFFVISQKFPAATGRLIIQYFTINLPSHLSAPLPGTLEKQMTLVRKFISFSHFLDTDVVRRMSPFRQRRIFRLAVFAG
jgi:hypothetical protein